MIKKFAILLLLIMLAFSAVPVYASAGDGTEAREPLAVQDPITFINTINVSENGGTFDIGFATVKFPKGFVGAEQLPISLNVEISAVDGVPGIEFNPDLVGFNKEVMIKVEHYEGFLYDKAKGENIRVEIKSQVLKVRHFSRYAFS